jgi:hypothetical protein
MGSQCCPPGQPQPLSGESNEDSLVTQLSCGSIDVLFTGDVESGGEASMLAAGLIVDIDVLKLAHHGSNTSSTAAFLTAAETEWGIISAGVGNQFGHPHPDVLARLAVEDVDLLYTDTGEGDDTIVMTSDCRTYQFSKEPTTPEPPTPTPTTTATSTSTATATATPTTPGANCDASYPTVCIPPPPPDLDCTEIPHTKFTVVGTDPHNFDGDNDGVGYES